MKKFYNQATAAKQDEGYTVTLDDRPIKTPGKHVFLLPTLSLAKEVTSEWNAQEEDIRPDTMPITQLCNTAIDRVTSRRNAVINELVGYAHTDLVCYRDESEGELVRLQSEQWQPVVDWLKNDHDIHLLSTTGILPITQSDETVRSLSNIVSGLSDFELTAFHACVTGLGSVALGLAVIKGYAPLDECWNASYLEQSFQEKSWGTDEEVADKRNKLKVELDETIKFWDLIHS